jgi:hypothetical protein
MAQAAGIENAVTVRDLQSFKQELTAAMNENRLRFVVCKIEESREHRNIPRTNMDPLENKYVFVRYLERTEGKRIVRSHG